MLRALPYIAVGLMVYILLLFVQTLPPEEVNDFIIKVDAFGLTQISRNEHMREDKIMRLEQDAYGTPIGSLEKTALLNHTVFIHATTQMVEYALGPPKIPLKSKNSRKMLYVYFLANDKWPTVFEFECVKQGDACSMGKNGEIHKENFALVKAYKTSQVDLDNLMQQENAPVPGSAAANANR